MSLDKKQLRLASCVNIIIEVHASLDADRLDPSLIKKFEDLKQALEYLELDGISEVEIQRVEQATNRLLDELRILFTDEEQHPIHDGIRH